MPELKVYEAERGYIDYTLTYGQDWSASAKRGTPVLRSDISVIYFYVKASVSASPFLSLSDASSSEIEWLDEDEGQIRVKLGTATEGNAGDNQLYELRVKFTDGSFVTAENGKIHIVESHIDTP